LKPSLLSPSQKTKLLVLARKALEKRLLHRDYDPQAYHDPGFEEKRGCFVTLKDQGELRGCIGQINTKTTLAKLVPQMAVAAALEDPRFEPVRPAELSGLTLEVSVLTLPQPVATGPIQKQMEQLRPMVDGVILEAQGHQATFLPQVWEQLHSKEEFLTALCQKAHLPGDYWRQGDLKLFTYQAQHFEEAT